VTDGAYNLPCLEVIMKLVKQMQTWGDERIKNVVSTLAAEGMKISIVTDIWYSDMVLPNIIRKDRRLQFGSWTLSIHS
jgi:hypothetical protein